MVIEYRRDFVENHGLTILEESDQEIILGYWKPVPEALRRSLETFHGKPIVLSPVSPHDPAVRLSVPPPETAAGSPDGEGASYNRSATIDAMAQRTRNLPPGEEILRTIITTAVASDATDLALWQISPYQWRCTVRVAGRIRTLARLENRSAAALVRLLKINGGLDLLEARRPQDGRVEFPWLPGRTIRVAAVGDSSGEALAIRFLNRSPRPLGSLGFDLRQLTQILTALGATSGLVVCCGPTGSGKTTTIAAMADILVRNGLKVVSVEDPVEYRVPGVLHLDSNGRDREYLPAALRQDPDALWIGEIRRREHVRPLMEALLSGHLVITTIHARGVRGTIARLCDLGASESVLKERLRLVCTQKLEGDPLQLTTTIEEGFHESDLG